jgi:Xaa-Pro aminopeptidase
LPSTPIFRHDEYAGQPAHSKLAQLRKYYQEKGASAYIVHDLAEIAWLLNLRGGDIQFSPVFQAYLICSEFQTQLFTDESKVGPQLSSYLSDLKVELRDYNQFWQALRALRHGDSNDKVRDCWSGRDRFS